MLIPIRQPSSYNQSSTLPAVEDTLLSFVCTFFNPVPFLISPNKPPILGLGPPAGAALGIPGGGGGGGAGGALDIPGGGGGGGGGADGAPDDGIGGGGGGAAGGWPSSSKLPGMAGAGGGEDGAFDVGTVGLIGLSDDFLSSIADSGRGGAMVPNSIEASCLALPPVGFSASSSSSEDEVESTPHSSSSGRTLEGRLPVGVDVRGGGSG